MVPGTVGPVKFYFFLNLSSLVFKELKRMYRIAINETKYGPMMYLHNDIAFIDELKEGRIYDQGLIESIKEYFIDADIILDIGAHCGSHSIIYSKLAPNAQIYAFEPQKKLFSILNLNIKNLSIKNVLAINCALGNKLCDSSMAAFCIDGPNQFQILNDDLNFNFGGLQVGVGGEPIKILTLDILFKESTLFQNSNSEFLSKKIFIKIDAEGFEPYILDGGLEFITKFRPKIFFEHNNKVANATMIDSFLEVNYNIFDKLKELNYNIIPIVINQVLSGNYLAIPLNL